MMGSAEPSSVQIKKMTVKFSHKHVQRQTGTSFTVPQPIGTAQDRPSHIRRSQNQHSNTVASVVVCPLWSSDSHDPAVYGASRHLPLLLPLLLDKPTGTPRCRAACRPSIALFFCDGDAPAAAVTSLSSSSVLLRFARSSSFAFFSFPFSSFLRCFSRASSCFRNSRSAFPCSFCRCLSVFLPFRLGVCGSGTSSTYDSLVSASAAWSGDSCWNSGCPVLAQCMTLRHSTSSSVSPFRTLVFSRFTTLAAL